MYNEFKYETETESKSNLVLIQIVGGRVTAEIVFDKTYQSDFPS